MNILLLGYFGSGKTTCGTLLAEQLWRDFDDWDVRFRKEHSPLPENLDACVRLAETFETDLLQQLDNSQERVISAVSGVVPPSEVLEASKTSCRLVYLQNSAPVLAERLAGAGHAGTSPWPATVEDIAPHVERMDQSFIPIADLVLEVDPLPVDTVVRLVIRMAM